MRETWRAALDSLDAGEHTVLLVVVSHSGSVPGKTGATAVASATGLLAGTIGGGAGERQLVDRAAGMRQRSALVRYDHTSSENDSLCSGSHQVAFLRLEPGDRDTLEAIADTLAKEGHGVLELGSAGLRFEPGQRSERAFSTAAEAFRFVDTIGALDTLYVVGGGHVSLALSRVVATLPFRIVVMDNRPELPTMGANQWASELRLVDYARMAEEVEPGERSWVAIMTHGHRHDGQVLKQLVDRSLRYLGMMGSDAKVAQLFAALEREGVPRERLERVHAPIGLAIASHSPEEIAISIAAQLVAIRNQP